MCPDRDFRSTPTETDVRVMPLLLRQFADSIDKRLRLFKIFEFVFLAQMMLADDFPTVNPGLKCCNLLSRQRGHAAAAGNTFSTRQFTHTLLSSEIIFFNIAICPA